MKSKRNRHTGRINAAKQRVLEQGQAFLDSKGKPYTSMMTGVRTAQIGLEADGITPRLAKVPVYSVVKGAL